jgi:superfamily II DNA or RNA helicase
VHHPDEYIFEDFSFTSADSIFILRHSSEQVSTNSKGFFDIKPVEIDLHTGVFSNLYGTDAPPAIAVTYTDKRLTLYCECNTPKTKLCSHQAQVMFNLIQRNEFRVFFDDALRHEKLKQAAADYGLEQETNLDVYFKPEYVGKAIEIKPRQKELIPVTAKSNSYFEANLLPKTENRLPEDKSAKTVLVFGKHKYYDHLAIELYTAATTQAGKLKNPLTAVNPFDLVWKAENSEEVKFYTAVSRFQQTFGTGKSESDIEGLKALVKNPLKLDVYYHDTAASASVQSSSIVPVQLKPLKVDLRISVDLKDHFYEVSGSLILNDKAHELHNLSVKYQYFILHSGILYLVDNIDLLRVVDFFTQHYNKLLIHESKFEAFRQNILSKLEDRIRVSYSYVKPATKQQLELEGFDTGREQIIYLSDSGPYVEITPVIRYGNVEIPILSKKQIYGTDPRGNTFLVRRDDDAEVRLTSLIMRQHPHFEEQINNGCFYLHKDRFLDAEWFQQAFELWHNEGITILGFNELASNIHKLNPHKANVSVMVKSGINWFDTAIDLRYGKQKVSLKHLHKSIRKKSRFVQLDDGTQGILPDEWIEKFSRYFLSGELAGEEIRTPRINFAGIAELYEDEMLNADVQKELALFHSRLAHFSSIKEVEVPEGLNATLRDYQKQGLNWLCCLDELNFGACLADDMGLGKTLQVIAFILSQRNKDHHNTNLVVVPTSLLFNWQDEIAKFAPSLKVLTIYGSGRIKDTTGLDDYEIVLTSYGTLQSDIRYLKEYNFNYVILDESQAIKNPDSLRYQMVQLLKSRNRIVLTGTPVENNTFDLYGQLSFACPGLLGSKQHFRDIYAIPIDRFKSSKRAAELQQKINPFILRRTKEQVATELPDKTEMVIYCEMGAEQRKVYDDCEKEIREYVASQQQEMLPANSFYVLQGLTKLRQLCNSPAIVKDEKYEGDSSKIEVLMEEIGNKSPNHKILVFSQFVTMLDLIADKLKEKEIPFEYLTGQTRDRGARVESFRQNEEIRVFLISLKAGGTGLNLTEADYVYLVDPWWNPAVENQAIDRSYRIGQKKNVVAVRLICPDTVESKMMKLQASKKELAGDLVKTDESVFKALNRSDLLSLLS